MTEAIAPAGKWKCPANLLIKVTKLFSCLTTEDEIVTAHKNLNAEKQGFSLASAIGHSPKIVPDVREFAVQFVRDNFRKHMLNCNAQ